MPLPIDQMLLRAQLKDAMSGNRDNQRPEVKVAPVDFRAGLNAAQVKQYDRLVNSALDAGPEGFPVLDKMFRDPRIDPAVLRQIGATVGLLESNFNAIPFGEKAMSAEEKLRLQGASNQDIEEIRRLPSAVTTADIAATLTARMARKSAGLYREGETHPEDADRGMAVERADLMHAIAENSRPHGETLESFEAGDPGSVRNDLTRVLVGLQPGEPLP